jgi:hypothetical protein
VVYCKILSVCPSGAVSPVPCGNERALWVASPRPEALTMALPHLTTPLSQGAGLTGRALPAQGGPPRIGRVDVLWPCWLGNVCVLGCSGLSVSRVPQDLTVPPGFNAPHRTGRAAASGIMRKAQEVERVGSAAFSAGLLPFVPPQADRSRLFRVPRQTELRKAFAQLLLQGLGVLAVLHQADEVVRLAHQHAGPAHRWFDLSLKPQIQHLV